MFQLRWSADCLTYGDAGRFAPRFPAVASQLSMSFTTKFCEDIEARAPGWPELSLRPYALWSFRGRSPIGAFGHNIGRENRSSSDVAWSETGNGLRCGFCQSQQSNTRRTYSWNVHSSISRCIQHSRSQRRPRAQPKVQVDMGRVSGQGLWPIDIAHSDQRGRTFPSCLHSLFDSDQKIF